MKVLVNVNLNDFSEETRERIAKETNDVELLEVLAKDNSQKVLCAVLENPETSQEILDKFSKSKNSKFRRSIACNVKIGEFIINRLADDSDYNVRACVATTKYEVPHRDALIKLAKDKNEDVRHSLSWWGSEKIRNDEEILGILLDNSKESNRTDKVTRSHIATMTIDQKKLEELSNDYDWVVRYYVVCNGATLIKTIQKMKNKLEKELKHPDADFHLWCVYRAIEQRLENGKVFKDCTNIGW